MHGHTPPELLVSLKPEPPEMPVLERAKAQLKTQLPFLAIVVLPTLLAALYLCFVASNQYVSEAHFVVRSASNSQGASSGLGQLLGLQSAASGGQSESLALGDYLTSHDAITMLDSRVKLVKLFQRPGIDVFNRLHGNPKPETVLKYYRKQVNIDYSSETGITTLKVRAFRPDDAYRIATVLLEVGESRVNELNRRSYDDAIRVARTQLNEAEADLTSVQNHMTQFRQGGRDIDPQRTSTAQIQLVAELRGQLAAARAQFDGMSGISPNAPQYRVMRQRVAGLAAQVSAEEGRLTSGNQSMAKGLGQFEELQLRQDFAAKRYAAAAAALEEARAQAGRQQLFVVRVVEPNHPVKSLYPSRLWTLVTIFTALLLLYGIGWLILAGVREHAA